MIGRTLSRKQKSGTKNLYGSVWIQLIFAENWKLKTENTVVK